VSSQSPSLFEIVCVRDEPRGVAGEVVGILEEAQSMYLVVPW
jgi:hypothetical protein